MLDCVYAMKVAHTIGNFYQSSFLITYEDTFILAKVPSVIDLSAYTQCLNEAQYHEIYSHITRFF